MEYDEDFGGGGGGSYACHQGASSNPVCGVWYNKQEGTDGTDELGFGNNGHGRVVICRGNCVIWDGANTQESHVGQSPQEYIFKFITSVDIPVDEYFKITASHQIWMNDDSVNCGIKRHITGTSWATISFLSYDCSVANSGTVLTCQKESDVLTAGRILVECYNNIRSEWEEWEEGDAITFSIKSSVQTIETSSLNGWHVRYCDPQSSCQR